MEMEQ
jgi:hypothetical protein